MKVHQTVAPRLSTPNRKNKIEGYSILEMLFAATVIGIAIGSIYLTNWRGMQIVRAARTSPSKL